MVYKTSFEADNGAVNFRSRSSVNTNLRELNPKLLKANSNSLILHNTFKFLHNTLKYSNSNSHILYNTLKYALQILSFDVRKLVIKVKRIFIKHKKVKELTRT